MWSPGLGPHPVNKGLCMLLLLVQSDQLVQACGSGNIVGVVSLLNGGAMVDSFGTDEFGVSDVC